MLRPLRRGAALRTHCAEAVRASSCAARCSTSDRAAAAGPATKPRQAKPRLTMLHAMQGAGRALACRTPFGDKAIVPAVARIAQ